MPPLGTETFRERALKDAVRTAKAKARVAEKKNELAEQQADNLAKALETLLGIFDAMHPIPTDTAINAAIKALADYRAASPKKGDHQ